MFSTIASIAGPIIGASMMSSATQDAADTQAGATRAGIDEPRRQFDLTRSDTAPYRSAATSAIDKLRNFLGLDSGAPTHDDIVARVRQEKNEGGLDYYNNSDKGAIASQEAYYGDVLRGERQQAQQSGDSGSLNRKFSISDFWNDPVVQASYQSGLDLGTKALKNAAPLTTGLDSGAALKELTKFGTDYTGNMAAGSQQRFVGDQNNVFNRLMALVGGGQVATNTSAAAGANTGNNISGMLTAQGNAAGAARIAGANAWSGALGGISNWWNQNQMLDKVLNRGGGTATPISNFGYTGMGAGGYQYG